MFFREFVDNLDEKGKQAIRIGLNEDPEFDFNDVTTTVDKNWIEKTRKRLQLEKRQFFIFPSAVNRIRLQSPQK